MLDEGTTQDPRPAWLEGPDPVQTDNGARPEDGDQSDVSQEYGIVIEEDFDNEAANLPTRQQLLNVCRSYLGTVEVPDGSNRTIIGEKFGWNGVAWCQEGDCVCEHQAGMPTFKTASTVEAVGRARKAGTFHSGTDGVRPGDSLYFHWPNSTRAKSLPDHVERVEVVHGPGDVTTIGFNVGNKCQRVHRRANFLGYERHVFNDNPAPRPPAKPGTPAKPAPKKHHTSLLKNGSKGADVRDLQKMLIARGFSCGKWGADGEFGDATEAAVLRYQRKRMPRFIKGANQWDGVAGHNTWSYLESGK